MKIVDLAIQAARKRQSSQTGFVHHCYESVSTHDTIPLLENFCFALALFRTRLSENVLEGKALLEKLFAFQVGDNFPVYLHEYPLCRDRKVGMRIYPALFWIYRDFQTVLGEELRKKLEHLLQMLPKPGIPDILQTPEAWAEFLINAQIEGSAPTSAFAFWDAGTFVYAGPQKQEKGEPALTLYDLYMSQAIGFFSKRALSDHPIHLKAALVHPFASIPEISTPKHPLLYFWGDGSYTHSLCFETKGVVNDKDVVLPQEHEPDAMEVAWYCDAHPDTQILVEGQKATTFQMGEVVQIQSRIQSFSLNFKLIEGDGVFFGHIFRANRSSQTSCKGENRYETYDWKISLRTVRRRANCILKISLSIP